MRTMLAVVAAAGLLVTGVAPMALGAPAEPPWEAIGVDVTLRDDDDDVLRNDDLGAYAGNDSASYIFNAFDDGDPATTESDRLSFFPWRQRAIRLQHEELGTSPVECENWSRVSFRSRTTPHWFEVIQSGGTALGDASITCWLDPQYNGIVVSYPGTDENQGEGECVEVARIEENPLTVTFTAEPFVRGEPGDPGLPPLIPPTPPTDPSGCAATITRLTREHPNQPFTETQLASNTSAPFELTAVQKPEKGNPDRP